MFLRVNGLFGWIHANDRRSVALFAGFIATLNLAAVLVLYLPLAGLDPDHAPVFAWGGYLTRYVPLVTLGVAAAFGLQMLWHVRSVQSLTAFTFVDAASESRLCRIVEPLAIAMGLPRPRLAVIRSPALNAFACGLGRKDAVIVVTSGLLSGLDDDELAAVVAHELTHIANGDIRLLAAANACLRMVGWLIRPRLKKGHLLQELVAFPLIMVVMPPLFLFVLVISLCAQCALRGSQLIRLLIASSREYIADARAVEVTQNPSALVSALEKIAGRSRLLDMPPGQDAMMIDGASEGAFATHPPVAARIGAIVAATGSMALIAPARRDTRTVVERVQPARTSPERAGLARASGALSASAIHRIGVDDGRNWFGLTPAMTLSALLAVATFAGLHRAELHEPAKLITALDPRPAGAMFLVAGRSAACGLAVMASEFTRWSKPSSCGGADMQEFMTAQASVAGPVGELLTSMTRAPKGMYMSPEGHFSNVPPPDVEAAVAREQRCFRTRSYSQGDRGWHRPDDPPGRDGSFDLRRWLARTESLAASIAAAATPADEGRLLKEYVAARKTNYETIDRFFGDAGIAVARRAFGSPAHGEALARLRRRLEDRTWLATLPVTERAEASLLAADPDDFVSCVARRRMGGGTRAALVGP